MIISLCSQYRGLWGLMKNFCGVSVEKMENYPIQPYQVGERLDRYLKKSPIGWASGQKLLRKKEIVILKPDGQIINKSDYRLEEGDALLVSRIFKDKFGKNQLDEERAVPREQASQILSKMLLFDNENIAVVNKLPGFSVQGGLNPKTNLFSLMSSKYKKELIHITHRLDRGTSGLVLFAKNKETAQLVQMSMEDKQTFHKFYLALSEGKEPISKPAYIRCNIQWTGKNKARLCSESQENSKDCITFYAPLSSEKLEKEGRMYRNLLGVKLLTGRKHQIRCHLSGYLDQPILNDAKYGGTKTAEFSEDDPRIFLHAFGMEIQKKQILDKLGVDNRAFTNPKLGQIKQTQTSVTFTATLPPFWQPHLKTPYPLPELVHKIKTLEKQTQSNTPKQRRVLTIE